MDRLETISLLLDTVDAGSFSAAARLRSIPVATLTRKIGQLEEQLGAALLIRSTRRLTLTNTGQRYVAAARHILSQVAEMERDAAGEFAEPTGRLVISAPRMFGRLHVLPIVGEFLRQYEGISIDLQLTDSNVDLVAGAADLALRIGHLPDSSLIATQLGNMRCVFVASPALLARYPTLQHPDDLALLPEVVLDTSLASAVPHYRAYAAGRPATRSRLSVSSTEAALDAAEAGIGFVQLMHYQVVDAIKADRLCALLCAHEDKPLPVHFIHPPLTQLPLKSRRFLDFASERLRRVLRAIAET